MDGQTDYPDITIKGVSKRVDQLFDSLLNLDKTKECREMYFCAGVKYTNRNGRTEIRERI